jgi:hypothetical protein
MARASVLCIECGFDKRKGRRLETVHRAPAAGLEEEDAAPAAEDRRRGERRGRRGLGSLLCIGGGLGLLIASLYVLPVMIMGPMLEMQQRRKVPWAEAVSWPFVAFAGLLLVAGLVMRAGSR